MTTDYQHDDALEPPPAPPAAPSEDAPVEDVAAERERLFAEMKRLQAQLAATAPTHPGEEAPYELKTWMGYPIYCCRYGCEWTTFEEPLAWEHYSDGRYFAIHRNDPAFVTAWGDAPAPPIPDA